MLGSSNASLAKRPHLESGTEMHQGGKKSADGSVSASSADARKKGPWGSALPMCHSPQPPCHPQLWFFTLVCFSIFLDQWRSITSNRFVLNMVQGHHLQLRLCPLLFCNFQQFNVKVAAAHHSIIQKEMDKLPFKEVTEPSSGGAAFYSSMFVVPKCTGSLWPLHNLWQINHYLHTPFFYDAYYQACPAAYSAW